MMIFVDFDSFLATLKWHSSFIGDLASELLFVNLELFIFGTWFQRRVGEAVSAEPSLTISNDRYDEKREGKFTCLAEGPLFFFRGIGGSHSHKATQPKVGYGEEGGSAKKNFF